MENQKFWVCMTDKFMSGWGRATNKINKFCIECDTYEQAEIIERNARKRPEMKYINININKPKDTRRVLVSLRHFDEMGDIWRQ